MILRYALLVTILYLWHLEKLPPGVALDSVYTSFRSGSRWSARPEPIFFQGAFKSIWQSLQRAIFVFAVLKMAILPCSCFLPLLQ